MTWSPKMIAAFDRLQQNAKAARERVLSLVIEGDGDRLRFVLRPRKETP